MVALLEEMVHNVMAKLGITLILSQSLEGLHIVSLPSRLKNESNVFVCAYFL
jgi:hypothetical protein